MPMLDDKLQLPVGTNIQLQQEDNDNPELRYNVRLIGYYPGKDIIVSNPEIKGRTVIIKEGKVMIARFFKGSKAIGFRCRVKMTYMVPYPHLHLSFPENFEVSIVRNASRVNAREAAMARNLRFKDEGYTEALILDLSTTGARIATRHAIAQAGDILQIRMLLRVDEEDRQLEIAAEVKKVNYIEADKLNARAAFQYGLMFKGINNMQKLVIHAFVLEHELSMR